MIIVTGDVRITPGAEAPALALARAHVARSRAEPGCLSHDVFLCPDDPSRLFFFERWADMAALQAHFALSSSRDFVSQLRAHTAQPPRMDIHAASPVQG